MTDNQLPHDEQQQKLKAENKALKADFEANQKLIANLTALDNWIKATISLPGQLLSIEEKRAIIKKVQSRVPRQWMEEQK